MPDKTGGRRATMYCKKRERRDIATSSACQQNSRDPRRNKETCPRGVFDSSLPPHESPSTLADIPQAVSHLPPSPTKRHPKRAPSHASKTPFPQVSPGTPRIRYHKYRSLPLRCVIASSLTPLPVRTIILPEPHTAPASKPPHRHPPATNPRTHERSQALHSSTQSSC